VSTDKGCENPKNLGKCGKGPFDFSQHRYKGHDGNCNKSEMGQEIVK